MNTLLKASAFTALAAMLTCSAFAAPLNLAISGDRRKYDTEKKQTESTNLSTEKWGYKVVIENKMFKPVEGLDIVYRVFKADDSPHATTQKLLATPGTAAIASLKPGAKFTFDTQPVILNKSNLKGGWIYNDNSKAKVEDGVAGIWLRVLKDGEIVAEFLKPPALKEKAKWE
jgi:hypothetical protein